VDTVGTMDIVEGLAQAWQPIRLTS